MSLAVQGGGAHGAFTWGVLDALLEDGRLAVEAVTGASAGAMKAVVMVEGWLGGGIDGARSALETFWRRASLDGSLSPSLGNQLPSCWMVVGWLTDGGRRHMAEVDKSEKITINVGLVDLGQIDLLVDEGFYANRTDFIRTAIRRQLESRADAVNDTVARRTLILGTQHLSRRDLEELRDAGQTVKLHVLGLATIANDVSPELALATIASVEVLGAFRAPMAVKAALANRTAT